MPMPTDNPGSHRRRLQDSPGSHRRRLQDRQPRQPTHWHWQAANGAASRTQLAGTYTSRPWSRVAATTLLRAHHATSKQKHQTGKRPRPWQPTAPRQRSKPVEREASLMKGCVPRLHRAIPRSQHRLRRAGSFPRGGGIVDPDRAGRSYGDEQRGTEPRPRLVNPDRMTWRGTTASPDAGTM
jgi:hypothetical protein